MDNKGDSYEDIPTYIKHWEEAKPGKLKSCQKQDLRLLDADGKNINVHMH